MTDEAKRKSKRFVLSFATAFTLASVIYWGGHTRGADQTEAIHTGKAIVVQQESMNTLGAKVDSLKDIVLQKIAEHDTRITVLEKAKPKTRPR